MGCDLAKLQKIGSKPIKAVAPVLAQPGDPLVMSDGQVVYEEPEPGSPAEEARTNKKLNPRTFRATKKRTMKDMPGDTQILKAVACVILFTVMGVGDREIADALGISPVDLKRVRMHTAYPECFNSLVSEFINANSEFINARLAAYAGDAVDNIMTLAQHGKKEETKLRANIDIADRAGINPKEQSKAALQINDLRIVITKPTDKVDIAINTDV